MALDPTRCPADLDQVAEGYVMESLPAADAAAFEEHLLTCAGCRSAVKDADVFVVAMRRAAAELRARSGAIN